MDCNTNSKWVTVKAIFWIVLIVTICLIAFLSGCTCKESDSLQSKACIYEQNQEETSK